MAELTSTGLTVRTQTEIQEEIETEQRAEISDRLDVSTTSPLGQHNRLTSRALRLLEEALQAIYLAIDPDSATGDALDRVCAITGTIREEASATTTSVVVNVDPGTYAIGDLVAQVDGQPTNRYTNSEAVVNGGASAANVTVNFEAVTAGAFQCPSNTLVISSSVSGWNSVVSNTEGDIGSEVEPDEALRIRRELEVTNPGSTSTSGIAADILANIANVDTVTVIENDTDATVDSIPGHSIEAIVYGPDSPTTADNLAVATQIWESKAAGIGTYGDNVSVDVTDSEGQVHTIDFTRPAIDDYSITVDVDVDSTYAGDTALKEAIAAAASLAFVPGLDVAGSMIAAWAHDVQGVLRVTDVTINAGPSFGVETVGTRQVARLQTINMTVTSTVATP